MCCLLTIYNLFPFWILSQDRIKNAPRDRAIEDGHHIFVVLLRILVIISEKIEGWDETTSLHLGNISGHNDDL